MKNKSCPFTFSHQSYMAKRDCTHQCAWYIADDFLPGCVVHIIRRKMELIESHIREIKKEDGD